MDRPLLMGIALIWFISGCGANIPPVAGGKVAEEWIEMTSEDDPKVRVKAIEKLGNIGAKEPRGIDRIIEALSDPSSDVRKVAIFAVVRVGSPCRAAFPRLKEMGENDDSPDVRNLAKEAYGNLSQKTQTLSRSQNRESQASVAE